MPLQYNGPSMIMTTNSTSEPGGILYDLYPNPNQGVFRVELKDTDDEISHLIITDTWGRNIIANKTVVSHNITEIEGLAVGTYMVTIKTKDGLSETKKLFVQP